MARSKIQFGIRVICGVFNILNTLLFKAFHFFTLGFFSNRCPKCHFGKIEIFNFGLWDGMGAGTFYDGKCSRCSRQFRKYKDTWEEKLNEPPNVGDVELP